MGFRTDAWRGSVMDTVKRAQLAAKARWAKPGARKAAIKRIRAILRVSKLATMAAKLNATHPVPLRL